MSGDLVRSFQAIRNRVVNLLEGQRDVALLLGRLAVGLLFLSTGWGKVHSIPKVTEFFISLGIPAPGFHAVLVSYTELLGGLLLCVGLATRVAAVPLAITMTVALATAKRSEIAGLLDLVGQEELTYLVVLVMIVILGPGRLALDHLVTAQNASRAVK